jgi:hypothetical protein
MDDENIRNSGKQHSEDSFPVLIEERNVVYSEWDGPAEFHYTCFLDFKNENDEKDYRR